MTIGTEQGTSVALTWTRREPPHRPAQAPAAHPAGDDALERLLALVARGDEQAFAEL